MLQRELLYAALGTGFTCLATVLGAGMVFFFKKEMSHTMQKVFLGFAAGVMIAASVWSLLIPAMEMAEGRGQSVILPVGGGFVLGGLFLMATLHNIPEGMAVGLSFSVAAQDTASGALAGALALALGMGLQNFPEGAAVSLPMKSQGVSRRKAFLCGAASGVVEPIFGLLTVLVAGSVTGIMPWVLAFAAGAMIYVVVEELIPEAQLGEHSHAGTGSVMAGFLVMMLLDVLLG